MKFNNIAGVVSMNAKSRKLIVGLLICALILGNLVAVVAAQPPTGRGLSATTTPADENKPTKTQKLNSADVAKQFDQMRQTNNKVKAADDFLKQRGFSAKTGADDAMGESDTFKGKDDKGNEQETTTTLKAQNYQKKGSKDAAAIAQIDVVAGRETRSYSFVLIAPDGDINKAEEYAVEESGGKAQVGKANSWWSCTKARTQNCGSTCVSALTSCWNGSWVYYLGCLAVKCGWCYLKAAACCGCDCSWWCRWAVGCCDA